MYSHCGPSKSRYHCGTFKIKNYRCKWGFSLVENLNKFKKSCYNLQIHLRNIFQIMFEGIKILVRLNVPRILFQKVGPIYDKAKWPVLVLQNGHFNFWKLPLNWKLFFIATSKTSFLKRLH